MTSENSESEDKDGGFPATKWQIITDSNHPRTSVRMRANNEFFQNYWRPIYAFARMKGKSPEDSEDLLQSFFSQLVTKDGWLKDANEKHGRFRNYLLKSFTRYLHDEWRKGQALKRGGGVEIISLNRGEAEEYFQVCDCYNLTPEEAFEGNWARTLLDTCVLKMRMEYISDGKLDHFDILKPFLSISEQPNYQVTVAKLGQNENAARVMVSRFRKRYRDTIRREIAETLVPGGDVEEEYSNLKAALSRQRIVKT